MKKPKNYYCHRSTLSEGLSMNTNLQIVQKIGQGSFGEVFKVFDRSSSQLMVVKKIKKECSVSEQAKILNELSNTQSFDRLKSNIQIMQQSFSSSEEKDKSNGENMIMMGCLGPSTSSIMKKIKKMNVYSMKKIAIQCLKKLKQIHSHLYIHRDIKPDNILMGNKYDSHSVYLIDFGLTTSYRKNSTKARKVFSSLVGTAKYCPISSHMGLQQYPKDDLESLGYVLLYFISGSLPWEKENSDDDEQLFKKILNKKKESIIQELCAGINCLRKYWSKVKTYLVGQKINYEQLIEYFDVGDPNNTNCYEFCGNCWMRNHPKQNDDDSFALECDQKQIIIEPRSGMVRTSIII